MLQPGGLIMRPLALLFAVTLPLQPLAAPAAAGRPMTICTAEGARVVRVDADGRPLPVRPDAGGCAHLWCDTARGRSRARPTA